MSLLDIIQATCILCFCLSLSIIGNYQQISKVDCSLIIIHGFYTGVMNPRPDTCPGVKQNTGTIISPISVLVTALTQPAK